MPEDRPAHGTHVYRTIDGLDVHADVYLAEGQPSRPAVFWIHGGALIGGSRDNIKPWQAQLYLDAGYDVVSIDYRLAPETKLAGILDDVREAWAWLHDEAAALLGREGAQPPRVAVIGHSAGGYLTLVCGVHMNPKPACLVSFYGYGDIAGEWYSRPDPFYCTFEAVAEEKAKAGVGAEPLTNGKGPGRGDFYLHCRQKGIWPREVAGHDPDTEPAAFDPYCPVRNVTPDYPPTMLLHGDEDTDVPYAQSVMMADELAAKGIPHELVTIAGGGHGFDGHGLDQAPVRAAFDKVLAFLGTHLRP